MRRIALFGASFDPPTGDAGHGGIVRYLAAHFPEVWLIPVFQHPFTTKRKRVEHTGYASRLEMLRLQFQDVSNVKIKESERDFYDKRERDGLVGDALIFGTYDLIEYLREENPTCVFSFVMGGDTLVDLFNGKWRRFEEILKNLPIVAIARKWVPVDQVDLSRFEAGIDVLEIPGLSEVSSTEVRRRIAKGESIDSLVDDKVRGYIEENRLYGKL
jgi:nicotinate (nicotinamide) nucleotide adenylyltransferase